MNNLMDLRDLYWFVSGNGTALQKEKRFDEADSDSDEKISTER